MIVGAVYNVINAGFIGSLHDTTLLAAVTFGSPLLGAGHGGRRRVRHGRRRAHLAAARCGRARPREGRRDQARLVVRRLGCGDRRGRARRHRIGPAAPPGVSPGRGRRHRARDALVRRRHARVRPRARRSVLSRADRACRGRRAPGHGRARRLHRGERRVRRPVHPRSALGRRRRGAGDRPREPRRRRVLRGLAGTAQRAPEPRAALVHIVARRAQARPRGRHRRAAPGRLPDRHCPGAQQSRGRLRRWPARGDGRRGPHRAGAGVPGDGRHARRAAAVRVLLRQGRRGPSQSGAPRVRDHGWRHHAGLGVDADRVPRAGDLAVLHRPTRCSRSAARSSRHSSWR